MGDTILLPATTGEVKVKEPSNSSKPSCSF